MTRRPSTMRITIPPTSRKPRTRTQTNSVFTQRLNPLFCTFLIGDLVLQRESKESMQSGNRCWTEREGFVISAAESMSKKGQRNGISVSLKSHRKSCSEGSQRILLWWTKSSMTPGMKSSTSYSWWKFSSEKILLDWVRHGNPKFGTKKFRICIIRIATRAWISKTTIIGRYSLDRSSSTWENTFL